PVPDLSIEEIQACLQQFTGEIDQIPPMYSALKHNGKKLYELAREGKTIERKARRIKIFELKLLDFSKDRLTLEVFCSKGTYIRSLAEDIGHSLGCGGTVKALRRLEAGLFSIEHAKTIEQLTAMSEQDLFQCLINVDKPLAALPSVYLSDEQAIAIKYGQSINFLRSSDSSLETWQGRVRMYHSADFLGLGEMLLDGKIAPKKLFNMNSE
ncbi:MAG: tRNA pseudouridine(55) synthase TruB, partial [Methylococcaceae bacterium]|nr:tRNA pseudouridine(55) synthase TruB [Methylococcaceae bacterium]